MPASPAGESQANGEAEGRANSSVDQSEDESDDGNEAESRNVTATRAAPAPAFPTASFFRNASWISRVYNLNPASAGGGESTGATRDNSLVEEDEEEEDGLASDEGLHNGNNLSDEASERSCEFVPGNGTQRAQKIKLEAKTRATSSGPRCSAPPPQRPPPRPRPPRRPPRRRPTRRPAPRTTPSSSAPSTRG